MATKPKAILSTHDGREASPITKASNVLFENGQTAQDILNDRQDTMISPVIENSSSMFKVGQGDNVDYSANVVNGAYESMVLKGKSMVNRIQEPSRQDVILPYEFEEGRHVTINDTKESGALGVELKGQTLVNTLIYKHTSLLSGATRDGDTFTLDKSQQWSRIHFLTSNPLWEVNETYTTILYDVVGDGSTLHMCSQSGTVVKKTPFNNNRAVFTMGSGRDSDNRCAYIESSTIVADQKVSFKVVVLKGDYSDIDVPFFTGMTSCKMPTLSTKNNLFDGRMEIGGYNIETGTEENNPTRIRCVDFIPINNPSNVVMEIINSERKDDIWIIQYDSNKNCLGKTYSFNIPRGVCKQKLNLNNNCAFIKFYEVGVNSLDSGIRYVVSDKSSILSLPEEVVLRSIGSLCDTLDCKTGEYVKRIGMGLIDGTVNGSTPYGNGDPRNGTFCVEFSPNSAIFKEGASKHSSTPYVSPQMPFRVGIDVEGVYIAKYSSPSSSVIVRVPANTYTEAMNWLKENPVTFTYELVTPVVTKINLSSTLKSWNTTTHVYSEIPENTLYPILSHSNPTYPVILKPSTKYSIVANSYSNNHTNSAINFNLGGATASTTVGNRVTTITTPSTLSNELLTMSGRGNKLNNVMVIEGDVVGDEPYFEGICDCKSPILSNVGKNLFDRVGCSPNFTHCASWWWEDNVLKIKSNGQTYNSVGFDFYLKKGTYSISVNEPTYIKVSVIDSHTIFETTTTGRTFTVSNDSKIRTTFFANLNTTGVVEKAISNIQLEESTTPTTYESYKSNILSANGDKIELTEDMFEQGHCGYNSSVIGSTYDEFKSVAIPSYQATRVRSKSLVKVKPNTTYFIKADSTKYNFGIQGFDNNKLSIGYDTYWQTDYVFTTPADMYYASLHIRKNNDGSLTPANVDYNCIQLSEVDKTIVLRSLPNGVCDTINVETGEYAQRIGEVVFDGSEDENWQLNNTESTTTKRFIIGNLIGSNVTNDWNGANKYVCDKLNKYLWSDTVEFGITVIGNSAFLYNNNIDYSIGALKTWLSQNPITVQYELETPIVKTVDLSGYPFSYENGHVILSSGSIEQSLTPKVEYSVATNRNGQIRSNQKMVERHQKQLDQLQAIVLANLVNSQYNQTLTTLKYELSRV